MSFSSELFDLDPLSPFPNQPQSLLYRSDSDSNFPNLQKEWSIIEDGGTTLELIGYDSAKEYQNQTNDDSFVSSNNNNRQQNRDEQKIQMQEHKDDVLNGINIRNDSQSSSGSATKKEDNGRITPYIQVNNGNYTTFFKKY